MKVLEFLEYLKYGDMSNLVIAHNLRMGDTAEVEDAQRAVISFINIGLQELHTRFNLKAGVEVVMPSLERVINLRSNDIIHVTEVTDETGEPLKFLTVAGTDYDIRTLAFKTYMLKEPMDKAIFFHYTKTCAPITGLDSEIDLPPAFTQAMVYFVAMRAFASVGGVTKEDHSVFHSRYQHALIELRELGYERLTEAPAHNVQAAGFL